MKIQPDKFDVQVVQGYGPGWVTVSGDRIEHSVVVGSRGQRFDWQCSRYDALNEAHFAQLADIGPELVIFGSGDRIRFPQPAWLRGLMAKRIGIETMDSQAACRTYNILAGEGRDVLLALLLEGSGPG